MRLITAGQMREADRRATEEFGLPGLLLMENAAQGAARLARELLDRPIGQSLRGLQVAGLCGTGNNGGDAMACARILANQGARALLVLLGDEARLSRDTACNWHAAKACGVQCLTLKEGLAALPAHLADAHLILDGLLGTGFKPPLKAQSKETIELINHFAETGKPVLAMDLPSGLDADSGYAPLAVQATATAVFAGLKLGLALNPFPAGLIRIIDIGLPPAALDHIPDQFRLLDQAGAAALLPPRPAQAHKGSFGHVFILGGSPGKTGALVLAGRGALASGAGLVTLALPQSLQAGVDARIVAAMSLGLPQTSRQGLSLQSLETLGRLPASAWVVGPGLGQEDEPRQLVRSFLQNTASPLVLDADALNAVSPLPDEGYMLTTLLTPHPGEAARLLDCPVTRIQADRAWAAREIARRSGAVCLLKGAASVLAAPEGRLMINHTGNNLLATGGSGDLLAGLAGGLLAQGLNAWQAGALAVYLHGRAADLAKLAGISRGFSLEDLPGYLLRAWSELQACAA